MSKGPVTSWILFWFPGKCQTTPGYWDTVMDVWVVSRHTEHWRNNPSRLMQIILGFINWFHQLLFESRCEISYFLTDLTTICCQGITRRWGPGHPQRYTRPASDANQRTRRDPYALYVCQWPCSFKCKSSCLSDFPMLFGTFIFPFSVGIVGAAVPCPRQGDSQQQTAAVVK